MKEEIQKLVDQIGESFQILEKILKKENIKKVDIHFPRGVIRTAKFFRDRLTFLKKETLKRNIAYHLILTDVYQWLLNRFDIELTGKEMIIKEGICLYGNIIAAIIVPIAQQLLKIEKGTGFNKAASVLVEHEIIPPEFKKELVWLWSVRYKEHIENLQDWECEKYYLEDYNRAVLIWQMLEDFLKEAENNGKI
jgi:hypothetical protein